MLDPINNSVLEYTCPYCAAVECDDYEVLDPARPVRLRCGSCGSAFTLLAIECAECEREIVGTWRHAAEARPAALRALCAACISKGQRHEARTYRCEPVAKGQ